jgi:hypothetical protein
MGFFMDIAAAAFAPEGLATMLSSVLSALGIEKSLQEWPHIALGSL